MLKAEGFWTGRPPTQPPNPDYPNGVSVDFARAGDAKTCTTALVCPAPSRGYWLITCEACDYRSVVTAAGRPDDPCRVTVPCKRKEATS